MTDFTLKTTVAKPFPETLEAVRSALADSGFGIITEIDMCATLKAKINVDTAPQTILGACMPQLAHQATTAEPSIAALLPCNVVVRADGPDQTIVEALDPAVMVKLIDDAEKLSAIEPLMADARARLTAALTELAELAEPSN